MEVNNLCKRKTVTANARTPVTVMETARPARNITAKRVQKQTVERMVQKKENNFFNNIFPKTA
jgi:hypothetical protein